MVDLESEVNDYQIVYPLKQSFEDMETVEAIAHLAAPEEEKSAATAVAKIDVSAV